jgi:prepilin-type N-terminal cleavage/methylation domain-containing protein/prepilin-type processing-associated H-X9-DG protein
MRRHSRHLFAFSLLELLVVIGIIGILLAILLPAIRRARVTAARPVCANNLRQIGALLQAYANDNHGELPACYAPGEPARPVTWVRGHVNNGGIGLLVAPPVGTAKQAYVKDADVFMCPGADGDRDAADEYRRQGGSGFLWWHHIQEPDPKDPYELGVIDYTYNYVPAGGDWYWHGPNYSGRFFAGVFPDLERHSAGQLGGEAKAIVSEATALVNPPASAPTPKGWHGDGGHVLYIDGHVVWADGPSVRRSLNQALAGVPAQPKNDWNASVSQMQIAVELRAGLKALDRAAGG